MILKAKQLPYYAGFNIAGKLLGRILKRRFNKLLIDKVDVKPGHSYLLLCNHLSFWDGFWAAYLSYKMLNKAAPVRHFYAMILKKQLQKNNWMRYFGCFSIAPYGPSMLESIDYAAQILNTPGNILLLYPQANLESMYVRNIELKKEGICSILERTTGKCQIIWSSNLVEYFESLKPSVYFHTVDCGSREDFDFDSLSKKINEHHTAVMKRHFRFTEER
jgi:hypothetical protein